MNNFNYNLMQPGTNFNYNQVYKTDDPIIETHINQQEVQELEEEIEEIDEIQEEVQEVQQFSYNSVIVQQEENETYENHVSAGTSRRAYYFANQPEQNHQEECISVPNKVKLVAYPNMNFSLQNNDKFIIQEEVSFLLEFLYFLPLFPSSSIHSNLIVQMLVTKHHTQLHLIWCKNITQ